MSAELLALVDAFLADIKHQSLVDGDRVRDFALDLRILLIGGPGKHEWPAV